jgi:NAD+ kinase
MLPIDLVLVRHGESEGNEALRLSKAGDHSRYTEEFRGKHSMVWRLTERGRWQAQLTGAYIREHLNICDRYYVSHCHRAMETAALMELPNARWMIDMYLREREWGDFDCASVAERQEQRRTAFQRKTGDELYWKPPGGESMAELCLRLDRVLDTLHRAGNKGLLGGTMIVCHGEVMWGFRLRLERLTHNKFRALERDPEQKIHNCQILHYTRRNATTP